MFRKFRKPIIYLLTILLAFPLALFASFGGYVKAADSGFRVADDFDSVDIDPDSENWGDNHAAVSDNNYVTSLIESSSVPTDYLRSTGYNFSIPSWATINGIELTVERKRSGGGGGTVTDKSVKLVKNNIVVGDNKADTTTAWTATDTVITYGGPTELWGASWAPSDINHIDFGSVFSAKRSAGGDRTVYVDQIRMKVYYSDTVAPVIAYHEDVVAEATSPCGALVDYVAPKATDNYDPESSAVCTPVSGSIFALGDTTITCNKSDSSGNSAIATTFNVKVQDTTGPVIGAPTSTPDTTGEETTISVMVSDVASNISYVGISVNSSSYNPMGKLGSDYVFYYVLPYDSLNPVTYQIKAIDDFGNETITDPISVIQPIDNDKPVITLVGGASVNVELNSPYHEMGATWSDNIDGSGSAIVSGDVVNTSVVGVYNRKYNYTDSAGNTANEVIRVVNVVKSTQSQITTLIATPGNGRVSLSWSAPLGAVSYNIYYKRSTDSVYPSAFIPTTNTYTEIIGLENGVEYNFAVVAIDAFGVKSERAVASATPRVANAGVSPVIRTVSVSSQETLPQEPATSAVTDDGEKDQDSNSTDDSAGKIKGDEEIDTSEEEESVNWTPWIILFILIILAGAATGGYFYWFAGEDEMEDKSKKADATVTIKEKTKSQDNNKSEPQSKSGKKSRRW